MKKEDFDLIDDVLCGIDATPERIDAAREILYRYFIDSQLDDLRQMVDRLMGII